jgi:hypothetical protein
MRVVSRRAIEFACNSKACAPPPVGTGGSGDGTGGHGDGTAKGYGGLGYANSKLSKSRAPGADPNIEWMPEGSDANASLKGIVTTPGGRKYAVSWDEFSIGPRTAKIMINQYSALLDAYPDAPAVPLGLGRNGVHDIVARVFGGDPFYRNVYDGHMDKATAFAVHDRDTQRPLFMGVSGKADRENMLAQNPNQWGEETRKIDSTQEKQYIISHEFGHILDAQARSQLSPNERRQLNSTQSIQLENITLDSFSIGGYGKSSPLEMVAEAFAVQTHGLAGREGLQLQQVTNFMLDGKAPKQLDWQS